MKEDKLIRAVAPAKQGLYDPAFEHDACGVGFVAHLKGHKSHAIVEQGLEILQNLDHRGACGCEENTGDGAGILIQMPHKFLAEACEKAKFTLPAFGQYGTGLIFLPPNAQQRRKLEQAFEKIVQSEGQQFLGWRTVPTTNRSLGDTAKASEPYIRQPFIGRDATVPDDLAFERKLYVIRKRAHNEIRCSTIDGAAYWYVCSLSYKTIVSVVAWCFSHIIRRSTPSTRVDGFCVPLTCWRPEKMRCCNILHSVSPPMESRPYSA